ncbi:hypothetical protein BKA83DRAFT_1100822 [Pisolithus microcarpus]|nr:hypothetical protein BKA83DRAFT_1100822 [Pisolithus microcarpus]
MREETTGVTTINETPSALAAMSVAVPTTDDSTAVPRARSISSQLSSSKLIILDGEVSVDIMNSNEAEINGGWKHGRDRLEELRSQGSSIPDGPSQVAGGEPNEPIFIPDLTLRLSDPEFSNVGGVTPEIVLVREAGPSLGSSVVDPGDDVVGPGLTTGCLTQVISDEDTDKSKNLDSLESKGRELVQNFATEAVGLPTFLSPPPRKHRSQTALSPPPRKRHSVTFASPIETPMHPNAHAGVTPNSDRGLQMPVEPFRQRTWCQEGRQRKDDRIVGGERFKNSYTSKDDALLPMLVPSKDHEPPAREPFSDCHRLQKPLCRALTAYAYVSENLPAQMTDKMECHYDSGFVYRK